MSPEPTDARALLDRFLDALNTNRYDRLEDLLSEDCVSEYPQSGEVIRGRQNIRAIFENYPGGRLENSIDKESARVVRTDAWVMTPTFALVRVIGSGDNTTAVWKVRYPDGSTWWVVNLIEIRDSRIVKQVSYFAPMFEAPAWRAQWVEGRG
ncbi:MAG TPA: nuclear transport factor 2 family protein [Candidatus Limnocylindria bacterium]